MRPISETKKKKSYPAKTPEGKVKAILRKGFDDLNVYYYMPVPCGYSRSGAPDFFVCLGGEFVGIETKADSGELSALQEIEGEKIMQSRGVFLVIKGEAEAKAFVEALEYDTWNPPS